MSPKANVSLHLPGPGGALLSALQRPAIFHCHPPANKNAAFQTPDGPNNTSSSTGRCQRWFDHNETCLGFIFKCRFLPQELHKEILETIDSSPVAHPRLVFQKKKPIPLKLLTPKIVEV